MTDTAPASGAAQPGTRPGIDPRGPRFTAGITAVLLAVVLLLAGTPAALWLLLLVALSFALGVARGVQHTWQSVLFRRLVRPRLAPPEELEDPRPPRFAQVVGLVVTGVGVVLGFAGVAVAVAVAAAVALVAALLNAVFGLCLGCELYVLLRRVRPAR
ncbi:DUF4395 family protein [Luteimicrobium subarcticum]|uniref:Uncharacterized protein DUF4395 n=1 Tax=Luteimicrobium subarcticum TaxID=620910 RepID=A0A2M8WVY8_9MICO|nr:DUF4395 family protein [Luteimicrobium subarcticum]PJI95095.1 uncharacterized protein DUF4395 [Luteimicrobium subarcticum]